MKSAAWSGLSFILFVITYFFNLNVYQFYKSTLIMEGDGVGLTLFGFWRIRENIPYSETAGVLQILVIIAVVLWILTLTCAYLSFKKKKEESKEA